MNPQTTVTERSSSLPVTLAEAKIHLRLLDDVLDTEVAALLEAAVEYCETVCGRSLRVSTNLTQSYGRWPRGCVRFDREPVKSIVAVTYFDEDDAEQTVDPSLYRLIPSSEAAAVLEFDSDFSAPSLSDRRDAVVIEYVAGYDAVPERAKAAIKLTLAELFGNLESKELYAAVRARNTLLSSLDWGVYR